MKYKYNGTLSTVLLVEDDLLTISRGDVVDIGSPPSSEFVLVEEQEPVHPHARVPTKNKVPKKAKRITNANKTETSGLR